MFFLNTRFEFIHNVTIRRFKHHLKHIFLRYDINYKHKPATCLAVDHMAPLTWHDTDRRVILRILVNADFKIFTGKQSQHCPLDTFFMLQTGGFCQLIQCILCVQFQNRLYLKRQSLCWCSGPFFVCWVNSAKWTLLLNLNLFKEAIEFSWNVTVPGKRRLYWCIEL